MTDDRLLQIFVKIHRIYHTGRFASPATGTLFCVQFDPAAASCGKRTRGTHFGAGGFAAAMTDRFDEFPRKPAVCTDFYATFLDRMILAVDAGADKHTRKAADTFGHIIRF